MNSQKMLRQCYILTEIVPQIDVLLLKAIYSRQPLYGKEMVTRYKVMSTVKNIYFVPTKILGQIRDIYYSSIIPNFSNIE